MNFTPADFNNYDSRELARKFVALNEQLKYPTCEGNADKKRYIQAFEENLKQYLKSL